MLDPSSSTEAEPARSSGRLTRPSPHSQMSANLSRALHVVYEIAALGALWLAFSGKLDALHLSFGLLSIALVVLMTLTLIVSLSNPDENESVARMRLARAIAYPFWLAWQIFVANLQVARMILSPKLPISPALLRFRAALPGALPKVILGNSITLTPGTFTLDIQGDEFLVHAISLQTAQGVIDGSMQRKVAALFGAELDPEAGVQASLTIAKPRWRAAPWTT